ncbi:hypothetical protein ACFYXM_20575 [Streptomyces sp. NPDC002476]|uniref:hypothetical protein n=1 Tax=Streptomyces sp. NPDC002476 TaxID=3364648 RepID=UPI003679A2C1
MDSPAGRHRTRLLTRRTGFVAGLCTTLLAVSACGGGDDGEGRDYAVPEQLCGVDVAKDTLAPLLPAGEKLAERDSGSVPGSARCALTVDGRPALSVLGDALDADADPFAKADWYLRLGKDAGGKDGARHRGERVLDRFALSVTQCTGDQSTRKYAVLVELAETDPVPESVADRREALKEFLDGYVPAALKKQGCA